MFILRIIAAHFRKVGRAFNVYGNKIAVGIETDNQEMKRAGVSGLKWLLISRLILLGVIGVLYTWGGLGSMVDYLGWVVSFYAAAVIITFCTKSPEPPKQEVVTPPSDDVAMKHAKEGRDTLLDIILAVGESLEAQITGTYTVQCPKTKGQLAHPHINRCIQVKNGVASTMVAFPFAGEIDKRQFSERFNDRMCQMLNAGELPYRQAPVFIGKDNIPRTAIQAIHSDIVGDRIILEVIRVTEEAIPLLNALDHESVNDTTDRDTLYDDDL